MRDTSPISDLGKEIVVCKPQPQGCHEEQLINMALMPEQVKFDQ